MLGGRAPAGVGGPLGAPCRPQPLHLHLPRILVPLALHTPQLGHALLQVGGSVAVLHLVVLAAVLGWGGERRETPVSKSSRHLAYGPEYWTGAGTQLGTCITWGQSMPSAGLSVPIPQKGRDGPAGDGLWGQDAWPDSL